MTLGSVHAGTYDLWATWEMISDGGKGTYISTIDGVSKTIGAVEFNSAPTHSIGGVNWEWVGKIIVSEKGDVKLDFAYSNWSDNSGRIVLTRSS